jgi:hypothetical protein
MTMAEGMLQTAYTGLGKQHSKQDKPLNSR